MNNSPFKFLNSYEKEDKDLFFGRDEETEALYQMTFNTRLILLYGGSGTGKTSLLQAGLANKFSETRWKDILIRRDDDINQSIQQSLRRELELAEGIWPEAGLSSMEAIRQIQQLTFLPIYLIFDQFEELFILSKKSEEQEHFFAFMQDLLDTNTACKVILVLREEFLANLWVFEKAVPTLFDHRFRVERMRLGQLEEVINGTLGVLVKRGQLAVEQSPAVTSSILERLNVDGSRVELAYLQVYLDRLYQLAISTHPDGLAVFTPELVGRLGNVEDVIGDFLDDQLHELEYHAKEQEKGQAIQLLGQLVSDEQTKKVLHVSELTHSAQDIGLSPEQVEDYLTAFEGMRILKRYTVKSDLKVELTHDVIAKKIWERLPEVDKQLRRVRRSLEQRYQDFQDGRGSFLGEKEVNAWLYYLPKLQLDEALQKYFQESESQLKEEKRLEVERLEREKEQVEKNRRLQKRIGSGLTILGSLIGVLLILTLYARSRLTDAQEKNIGFLLQESQNQVRGLDFDNALELLGLAYNLQPKDQNVGKGLMEMAYFMNESGHLENALGIADTLSEIFSRALPVEVQDQMALRNYLSQLDAPYFDTLENRYYPQLISVPGGTFTMGCDTDKTPDCFPNELPAFTATVSDFALAKTETTVWQYYLFTQASGSQMPDKPAWGWIGDYPVGNVKWSEAMAYCNWLKEVPAQNGPFGYRLPSETEWEYAAKSGSGSGAMLYSGADDIDVVGWYEDNCKSPQPIGKKAPNALGIYDLSGNVWEWCSNLYYTYPAPDTSGTVQETERVLRGGAYDSDAESAVVTGRQPMNPNPGFNAPAYGFRVAADPAVADSR